MTVRQYISRMANPRHSKTANASLQHTASGETLVVLKPQVIILALVSLFGAFGTWWSYSTSLAQKADITAHNTASASHPIVLKDAAGQPMPPRPIAEVVAGNAKAIAAMPAKLDAVADQASQANAAAVTVRNGFYEQRAEGVALRAVEQGPADASNRRKLRRYKEVKAKVVSNLKAGKDAQDGLRIAF